MNDEIDEMNNFTHPQFEHAGTRRVKYFHVGDLKPRKFDYEDDLDLPCDEIFECGEIHLHCMNAPNANLDGIDWEFTRTSDSHISVEVGFTNKHYLKYPKFVRVNDKHNQHIYEITKVVLQ